MLGAISGAGFEAVGMADSIASDTFALQMGVLEPGTVKRLQEILAAKRLDALVEIRNPIDINPGADDEAHLQITEAFLEDPGIDAVVVGLDPTAPAIRALEASKLKPGFDMTITVENGQLMAQATRQAKTALRAESETKFFPTVVEAEIEFIRDEAGKATHLVLRQGGVTVKAPRKQ